MRKGLAILLTIALLLSTLLVPAGAADEEHLDCEICECEESQDTDAEPTLTDAPDQGEAEEDSGDAADEDAPANDAPEEEVQPESETPEEEETPAYEPLEISVISIEESPDGEVAETETTLSLDGAISYRNDIDPENYATVAVTGTKLYTEVKAMYEGTLAVRARHPKNLYSDTPPVLDAVLVEYCMTRAVENAVDAGHGIIGTDALHCSDENMASGQTDGAEACLDWEASSGHLSQMLDGTTLYPDGHREYTYSMAAVAMGVGAFRTPRGYTYYIEVFVRGHDISNGDWTITPADPDSYTTNVSGTFIFDALKSCINDGRITPVIDDVPGDYSDGKLGLGKDVNIRINYDAAATSTHGRILHDAMAASGLNYSSTNPAVATVDTNGKVHGVSAGKATIRCWYPGNEDDCVWTIDVEVSSEACIHAYSENSIIKGTPAGCFTDGLTDGYKCLYCKKVLVAQETIPAYGEHNYEITTWNATCTEPKKIQYYCLRCDECHTDEIGEPLGHDFKLTKTLIEPTCGEGLGTFTCSRCHNEHNETLAPVIAEHTWVLTKTLQEQSCTRDGKYEYTCSVCGGTKTETRKATGHDLEHHARVEKTCTEDGNIEYWYCKNCKKYFTDKNGKNETTQAGTVLKATGHTVVTDKAVAATCTKDGKTAGSHCSKCSTVLVAQEVIPATGHSYDTETISVRPTCTTEGKKKISCSKCGDYYFEKLEPTGHEWDEGRQTQKATCYRQGKMLHTCASCGSTYTEYLPMTDHTPVTNPAVEATCTKSGLTEGSHCSVCSAVLVAQEEIKAKGHIVVTDPAVAATCHSTGLTEGSHCSRCNTVLVAQKELKKTSHQYDSGTIITYPTIKSEGIKRYRCTNDGCDDYYDEKLPKLTKSLRGDANMDGVISIIDAMLVLNIIVGTDLPFDLLAADLNNSGAVDIADAMILGNHLSGLDMSKYRIGEPVT